MISFLTAGLGGALIVSAASKLPDRSQLRAFLSALGVPRVATEAVARVAVTAETAVGLVVIIGFAERVALVAALVLTGAFVVAQAVARARNVDIQCGCLGFLEADPEGSDELVRAMLFFTLTAVLALAVFRWSYSDEALARALGAFAGAGVVLANANLRYAKRVFFDRREGLRA